MTCCRCVGSVSPNKQLKAKTVNYLQTISSCPMAIACIFYLSTTFTTVSAESGQQVASEDKLSPSSDKTPDALFAWPEGERMAVSLSYDDAIDSQLDNAIPALDRHNLKASFYLTLASPTLKSRIGEWRAAAVNGHELGNHTIYHPCSTSLPDREWVASYYNIDNYQVEEIVHEANVANSYLHAIDGKIERTYTPPCGDTIVSGKDYIPVIRSLFVSVKGFELVEPGFATIWGPTDSSGQTLIDRVKAESAKGTKLFNILFHGIGGDYLTVSCKAHEELLEFLAENRKIFWVDSYLNISKYMIEYRAQE